MESESEVPATEYQSSLRISSEGAASSHQVQNEASVGYQDVNRDCEIEDATGPSPILENEDDSEPSVNDVPTLFKKYLDTMAHVFEGYSEVFKQSDEHESFVIDKIEKVEETAQEHLNELIRSKQAHFQKLNMLSATLSFDMPAADDNIAKS